MIHQRKRYSKQFKEQVIELVRLGKSVPEVAEELDHLLSWVTCTSSQYRVLTLQKSQMRSHKNKFMAGFSWDCGWE